VTEPVVVVSSPSEGVALVTLNRPAARNAINVELAQGVVDAVGASQSSRCVVITGNDPAFCAGLDLRNLGTDKLSDLPQFLAALRASTVPLIAAVNGPAVTGGFEIALACDFIVASERAAFADTHVRVGVYPGPVLVDLPRRVGMAKAREMSMTGNFVDAETALRIGLANHVVPHDDLLPLALSLAAAIAEQDPRMITTMRADWDETGTLPPAAAHRRHYEIAVEAGFAGSTSDGLRSRMSAVVARAHEQRGPEK
jgi:enoyl-CoA hydratase